MASNKAERGVNVVVLGEAGVGKTLFADRFIADQTFARYSPWQDEDPVHPKRGLRRALETEEETWYIDLQDVSLTPWREQAEGFAEQILVTLLENAVGFVLLYDITKKETYDYITTTGWWKIMMHRKEKRENGELYPSFAQRFGGVIVGNKLDLLGKDPAEEVREREVREREVRRSLAEEWAAMHGMRHFEVDTFSQTRLDEVMRALMRSVKRVERWDDEDIERQKYTAWKGTENAREAIAEEEMARKNSLSRYSSRLRDALPSSSRTKAKEKARRPPTPPEKKPWHMFLPAGLATTGPPGSSSSSSETPLLFEKSPA